MPVLMPKYQKFIIVFLLFLTLLIPSFILPITNVYAAEAPYPALPSGLDHRYVLYYWSEGKVYILEEIEFTESDADFLYFNGSNVLKGGPAGVALYDSWEYKPSRDTDWVLKDSKTGGNYAWASTRNSIFYESSYVIYSDRDKTGIYFSPNSSGDGDYSKYGKYWTLVRVNVKKRWWEMPGLWIKQVIGGVDPADIIYWRIHTDEKPVFVDQRTSGFLGFGDKGDAWLETLDPLIFNFAGNDYQATCKQYSGYHRVPGFDWREYLDDWQIVGSNWQITNQETGEVYYDPVTDTEKTQKFQKQMEKDGITMEYMDRQQESVVTWEDYKANEDHYVREHEKYMQNNGGILAFLENFGSFFSGIIDGVGNIGRAILGFSNTIVELANNYVPFLSSLFAFLPAPIPQILSDLFLLTIGMALFRIIRG